MHEFYEEFRLSGEIYGSFGPVSFLRLSLYLSGNLCVVLLVYFWNNANSWAFPVTFPVTFLSGILVIFWCFLEFNYIHVSNDLTVLITSCCYKVFLDHSFANFMCANNHSFTFRTLCRLWDKYSANENSVCLPSHLRRTKVCSMKDRCLGVTPCLRLYVM